MTVLTSQLITSMPCVLGCAPQTPAATDYSLETAIVSFLGSHPLVAPLVGARFYPLLIPRDNPPSTWPAIAYEVSEVDHVSTIQGSGGMATATIELDCYSNVHADAMKLTGAVRRAFQGFSGWMGCVAVWGIWPEGQDEDAEAPQDSSGVWWFRRGLTYSIQFYESVPTF